VVWWVVLFVFWWGVREQRWMNDANTSVVIIETVSKTAFFGRPPCKQTLSAFIAHQGRHADDSLLLPTAPRWSQRQQQQQQQRARARSIR
jgi:hypothetical protein